MGVPTQYLRSWQLLNKLITRCCRVDGELETIHSLVPELVPDQNPVIWNDTSAKIYPGATAVSPFSVTVCVLQEEHRAR
jgi:hypothetical protein